MMQIDYAGNVMRGFQQGREMRSDMETQRAMAALVGNPNDPQALSQLAQWAPDKAMAWQKQQAEIRKTQLEDAGKKLTTTLQLLGSARDETSYQRGLQTARQMGLDVSQAPPNFDPQWVSTTAQQAQALLGKIGQEAPEIAQQYNWYRGLPPEQQSEAQQFIQMMRPPNQTPVIMPHNVTPVGGGQGGGSAPTATGPNGEKVQWNGSAWVPVGGSGGNVGGGFPDPLAPL